MSLGRLPATTMFDWAFHQICQALQQRNNNLNVVTPIFPSLAGSACYGALFPENIILLNPACDDVKVTPKKKNVGSTSLAATMAWVDQLHETYLNPIIIIPLAECRDRYHWTCLLIANKKSYFYDPKGYVASSYYSLKPMAALLKSYPLEAKKFCALQKMRNDTDCGYFVGYIIAHALIEHMEKKQAQKIPNIIAKVLKAELAMMQKQPSALYQKFKTAEIIAARGEEEKAGEEIDPDSFLMPEEFMEVVLHETKSAQSAKSACCLSWLICGNEQKDPEPNYLDSINQDLSNSSTYNTFNQ